MSNTEFLAVPEYLKGEKATGFLEWRLKKWDQYACSANQVNQLCANFLCQPFAPEMITAYFEGWADQEEVAYRFCYWNSDKLISISAIGKGSFVAEQTNPAGNYEKCLGEFYPQPKTLNDFTSDCQRAGISLTWKK